jgi:hypothetical protein
MPSANTLDRTLFGLGFALVLALSWPGIEVHADPGIAPSSRELTGLNAAPPTLAPPVAQQGESCAASDPELVAGEMNQQREALGRMAQAMEATTGEGGAIALDGRGYGYFPERNPAVELARLQREAQIQARERQDAQ